MCFKRKTKEEKEWEKRIYTPLWVGHSVRSAAMTISNYFNRFPEKANIDKTLLEDIHKLAERIDWLANIEEPDIHVWGK